MDLLKFIGSVVAGGAVLIGVIGGIWSLWDRWRNRKPNLTLFAPYHFSCRDAKTSWPILMILARISNSSKQNAFLYLETMGIEVYSKGKWHKLQRLEIDQKTPLETDFSESEKVRFGLNDVKYLNRFGDTIVSYDKPLCGYIPAARENEAVFNEIDKIRINIKDCRFKLYKLEVDLKEQRKRHDPTYRHEGL